LRRRRRHASFQRPLGASSSTSRAITSAVDISCSDPRVDDRVGDVDQQVDEDEHHGHEQHAALQHGVVALLDGLRQPVAEPLDVEDGLGQDRARQQEPGLEADDGDHRQERVAEDVASVDDARRDALGPRRPHVVLVLHVEDRRPGDARDHGQRDRAERDGRQDQVLDRIDERLAVPGHDAVEDVELRRVLGVEQHVLPALRRQPAELDGEDVLQHQAQDEDGDRDPEQ
jgi:hypothetical protein